MRIDSYTFSFSSFSNSFQGFETSCLRQLVQRIAQFFQKMIHILSNVFSRSIPSQPRTAASDAYWKKIVQPNWSSDTDPAIGHYTSDRLLTACQKTGRTDCRFSKILIKRGEAIHCWFTAEQQEDFNYLSERAAQGEFNRPDVLFMPVVRGRHIPQELKEREVTTFKEYYPSLGQASFYLLAGEEFDQINRNDPQLPKSLSKFLFSKV